MIKYMRKDSPNEYGLLELQDKILEIMIYIDRICKENHIEYSLLGGSALGAKRHGGFIPWDDDLDIFMTPQNYEKFRKCFYNKRDFSRFYLQEWGRYSCGTIFAKLRMNNTLYIEPGFRNKDMHQGIYVDIFMLHTCSDNYFIRLHQYFWSRYITAKRLANCGYSRRGGVYGMIMKVLKKLPYNFMVDFAYKQVCMTDHKVTRNYCNFMGKARWKNGVYQRKYFEKPVYMEFETVQLKGPKYIEEFLTDRFGDYMKYPSKEQIKWEQHAEYWNADIKIPNRDFTFEKEII